MQASALAAHRFGYAEASLRALQGDPRGWVLGQFDAAAQPDTAGLLNSAEAGALTRRAVRAGVGVASPERAALRLANLQAEQRRWQHVVATPTPVAERWTLFWANHFSVSATKGTTLGLVWPFEREAIRPHALGRFFDLLRAATLHPAMLLYLDNAQSIGPHSPAGRRRERGLNENLARELLELHTLGVERGAGPDHHYTQTDVTELARLLTGWTVAREPDFETRFQPALHEPGRKRVIGKDYPEGPQALDALLLDLSRHPATARFVAGKLARHFVADEPPAALVDALAERFAQTDGDLRAVATTLFGHPLAWRADTPGKLKRPEEWLLSVHRVLKLPITKVPRLRAALDAMGQAVGRAPSPQGWLDATDDWLAPDALWKRVEWASAFAAAHADAADARELARLVCGTDLSAGTQREIERAASGAQALALFVASPEMLWR